ncbi:calcium/proton exchanger [Wilcoxina mikolae CBS 423.85]|nr:calcium/proton exchanger [Wilcoxina mikolae CBS 423.85]
MGDADTVKPHPSFSGTFHWTISSSPRALKPATQTATTNSLTFSSPLKTSSAEAINNGSSRPHTNRSNTLQTENGGLPQKQKLTVMGQLKAALMTWLNCLLIFVPVGIATHYAGVNPTIVFVMNFIAIIPLAGLLSNGTEQVSLYFGEVIGGLLNATFGNAVELIVAVLALIKREVVIVQTSLIGSILSNLLLVLGGAFLAGGFNRIEQNFNTTVAQTAASLLTVCCASLIVPTAFHMASTAGDAGITQLSRGTAVILLVVYASYLVFQLKTHEHLYSAESEKTPKGGVWRGEKPASLAPGTPTGTAPSIAPSTGTAEEHQPHLQLQQSKTEADEKEEPELTLWFAITLLVISTVLVALCAECLVASIDHLVSSAGISRVFVGLILLPIVGNAAEHATAVTVAMKDKMDLSIAVAVGSSMQIALLVIPLIVILGWILGIDEMNLYFDGFQVMILFVTVLLVNYLIQDGKSNYLEGNLLLALYMIIALASWFYPSDGTLAQAVEKTTG